MARVIAEATRPGPSGPVRARIVSREARDQLGHWVAPPGMRGHPCPHACCRGRREHPHKLPVRLDRDYLRSLSEQQIETELERYYKYRDDSPRGAAGWKAVSAEVDRRDAAAHRRRRYLAAREEHQDEVYRQWLAAENATNGYMLNKAGKKAGINERSLFTGPESRVAKYASPELIEWFESHPRPTRETFTNNAKQRRDALSRRRIG